MNQENEKTQASGKDRRKSNRKTPSEIPSLESTSVVAGPDVELVNVSEDGGLFESSTPLQPGSKISVHLVGSDAVLALKGRVVRSKVSSIINGVPMYHSAVVFDETFPLPLEDSPVHLQKAIRDTSAPRNEKATVVDRKSDHRDEQRHLIITASVSQTNLDIDKIFSLKNKR